MLTSMNDGVATTLYDASDVTAFKSPQQLFQEHINSILSAPLPRCLQSGFNNERSGIARLLGTQRSQKMKGPTRLTTSLSAGPSQTPNVDTFSGDVRPMETSINSVTLQTSSMNDTSTSLRVPIYEQLLRKGRLQQEHLEQLRQEAVEREVRELRPAPRIPLTPTPLPVEPPRSTRRLPPEGQRIEDKLLQRAKDKAEQEAQAAQQRKEREEEDLAAVATFHPHISALAQAAKARYKEPPPDRAAWRAKRLEELAQIRQIAEQDDLREIQPGPVINRRSAKLAAEKRAREGLEGLPMSEVLTITEHRQRLAQLQAAEAEREARENVSPSITHHAAMMHRAGDVGSRLHAESYDAAIRRVQREVEWREAHTPFQPEVTTLASVTAPRYQRENEARADAGPSTRDAFQPVINPVSAAIAERLPETPMQRLCRPSAVHSLASYVDPSRSLDTSVSAAMATPRQPAPQMRRNTASTPNTNPPLVSGPSPSPLPSSIVASLDAYERRRQARLDALRREQSQQELQECTFQPQVNARSIAMAAEASHSADHRKHSNRVGGERRGPAAVAQRNEEWQQRREQHMETMRQWQAERAAAAVAEMTKSSVREREGKAATQAPFQSVYGGDGRAWGVEAYLARQQLARAQRQERREQQEKLRQSSNSSRPTRTAPVPTETAPLRDCRPIGNSTIRSLRLPVSAPQPSLSSRLWTSDDN